MLKIENVVTPSPEQWRSVIMGARNPMNSWDRSDSEFEEHCLEDWPHDIVTTFENLGPNDLDLMKRLRNAGTDHRKFMRMITVYVDITGPLYWWKEMDTYQVGVVKNSCSTMHKIAAKEFEPKDFSHEHLIYPSYQHLEKTIDLLNIYRWCYTKYDDLKNEVFPVSHEVGDIIENMSKKEIWWQMIQLLPSSYNQKRTVMMNYEVLANIYKSRKNHKLDEWAAHSSSIPDSTSQALYSKDLPFGFCDWIKTLPYSELITGEHFLTHDEIMEKLDKWAKDAEHEV